MAARAEQLLKSDFSNLKLNELTIKGKKAYSVQSTPHAVLLRAISSVLKTTAGVNSIERDLVIRRLQTVLAEGVPCRIYKLDIESFFERVDRQQISGILSASQDTPRLTTKILKDYFFELSKRSLNGLPRGIPLRATLSEIVMKEFDKAVSKNPHVYFHGRFVDDIVIITGAKEDKKDFLRQMRSALPVGLRFNANKTKIVSLLGAPKPKPALEGQFDYLGYRFSLSSVIRNCDGRFERPVVVSMAKRKVQRLKTKMCVALCQYIKDGNGGDLERRFQLLTGNYSIRDFGSGRLRSAGLYSSYKRMNSTESLEALDSFLKSILVGNRSRTGRRLSKAVPASLRRIILRYSFLGSFNKRTFYNLSPDDLVKLARCWQYA